MIVCIDEGYLTTIGNARASQLYCEALDKGHYFDGNATCMEMMRASVNDHASTFQKEMMKTGRSMNLTGKLRQFLTRLNASDFSFDDLLRILTKPSRILVENSMYEGPVYDHMMRTYYRDPSFGNLYAKLKIARDNGFLTYEHGGGCSHFKGLLEQAELDDYKGISKYKFCTIIDRDADGPEYKLIETRNNLFKYLADKSNSNLEDNDIYTLDQQKYIWHMWYKREIENYFPDTHFKRIGVDPDNWPQLPEDRNYKKLSEGTGFKKDKLKNLTDGMSREKYEEGLKMFHCNGYKMSELQLFLLKLVKLI